MIRRWVVFFIWVFTIAAPPALAQEPLETTTSTAGMSAEDIELALYLDMLENMELFEQWELLELLPVLEEDE